MNKWGIPVEIENKVKLRDKCCVYCGKEFNKPVGINGKLCKATWEHIDNARWNDKSIMEVNISLCCASCNSSKGQKKIREWFKSEYCIRLNINEHTVAAIIKLFLREFPS
jgi:hypothetical protein